MKNINMCSSNRLIGGGKRGKTDLSVFSKTKIASITIRELNQDECPENVSFEKRGRFHFAQSSERRECGSEDVYITKA